MDIKIIISNLPKKDENLDQFFVELVGYITRFLINSDFDFDVKYVTTFENLEEELNESECRVLLFSNFPPNSAYSDNKIVTMKKLDGGYVASSQADGYDKTKLQFAYLLDNYANMTLEVITGAPFGVVSNFEIISLSSEGRVFVQRKQDWLPNDNYYQSFADHVIESIRRHLQNKSNPYDRIEFYQKRFTRTKALFFGEKGDKFTEDVLELLKSNFGQMSFNAFIVHRIEHVHNAILAKFPEVVVLVDIPGKWLESLTELTSNKNINFILITSAKDNIQQSDNVSVVWLEPHKEYDFSYLIESIEKMASPATKANTEESRETILSNYYDTLSGDSEAPFYEANRYIVRMQHELIRSVQSNSGLSIFAPAASLSEIDKYIKILSVISPYSLLTYAPTHAKDLESEDSVGIQKLWDLPGSQMAFLSPGSLQRCMKSNASLLKTANIQFVPTPSLSGFTESDWDNIGADRRARQTKEGWHQVSDPIAAFPAASLGSHFSFSEAPHLTMLDEKLSKISELNIPYIDSNNSEELSKLLEDENESLSAFHIHAAKVIDECRNSVGNESMGRILYRFEKEIEDGVKSLDSQIKRIKRTNSINLVSGSVLTASFTLMSVYGVMIPQSIAAFAGTGGAIGVLGNALSYLNELQNIKANEFHLFWKLKNSSK